MGVSLNNKRNTKIVNDDETAYLVHHGSVTCDYNKVTGYVIICLHGWDTTTTRGKINAFIQRYVPRHIQIYRKRGETWINNQGEHFELESSTKPLMLWLD